MSFDLMQKMFIMDETVTSASSYFYHKLILIVKCSKVCTFVCIRTRMYVYLYAYVHACMYVY